MNWSEKIKSILSSGLSLDNIGVNNWALDKQQTIDALNDFKKQGIAVLGGDVYEIIDGTPESNYDNWYCDQNDGESFKDFSDRSIASARKYVNDYKHPTDKSIRYALVALEE